MYALDEMNPDSVSFQQDGSKEMEFVEVLPEVLPERGSGDFWVAITKLPRREEWRMLGLGDWEVRSIRPVYGWRGDWPVVSRPRRRSLWGQMRVGGRDEIWSGLLDFALEGMELTDE